MNQQQFIESINKNFKNIDKNFFINVENYKKFLQQENSKFNLTKLANDEKIYEEYFFESLIPYRSIDFVKIKSILDIGSGSGIPGVALKILYPHLQLTIIESNKKKVNFLIALVKLLKLVGVHIINKRAENINNSEYETFDLVTSRAVAPLPIILELSVPYAKINGLIIQPKSINFQPEMYNIVHIIKALGGTLLRVDSFVSITHTHNVVIVQKQKPTPRTYPRAWSKIVRR
jgi:16S rRNA (guanine527-N7)-methyltransferase